MEGLRIIRDPGGDSIVRIVTLPFVADGSLLLVPAGSVAFFVCNGAVSEPYPQGRWELNTGVSPFFIKFRNLMTHGDPGMTVSVFYVSTHREHFYRTGTGEILFREKRFRQTMRAMAAISLRYRIASPLRFLYALVGAESDSFSQENLDPAFRSLLLMPVTEKLSGYLSEREELFRMQSELSQVGASMTAVLRPVLSGFGIELAQFSVESLTIPETELSRLQRMEDDLAEGTVQTAKEKHYIDEIYGGDLGLRTMVEVLTGTPRGPQWPGTSAGGGAPNGTMGGMLGMMMQLAALRESGVLQNPISGLRDPGSLFGDGNRPSRRTGPGHFGQDAPEADENAPGVRYCPHCGAPVDPAARVCLFCSSSLDENG